MDESGIVSPVTLVANRYELVESALVHIYEENEGAWREITGKEGVFVHLFRDHRDGAFKLTATEGVYLLIDNFALTCSISVTRSSKNFLHFTNDKGRSIYGFGFDRKEDLLPFLQSLQRVMGRVQAHNTPAICDSSRSSATDAAAKRTTQLGQSTVVQSAYGGMTNRQSHFNSSIMPPYSGATSRSRLSTYCSESSMPLYRSASATVLSEHSMNAPPSQFTTLPSTPTKKYDMSRRQGGSVPSLKSSHLLPHGGGCAMSVDRAAGGHFRNLYDKPAVPISLFPPAQRVNTVVLTASSTRFPAPLAVPPSVPNTAPLYPPWTGPHHFTPFPSGDQAIVSANLNECDPPFSSALLDDTVVLCQQPPVPTPRKEWADTSYNHYQQSVAPTTPVEQQWSPRETPLKPWTPNSCWQPQPLRTFNAEMAMGVNNNDNNKNTRQASRVNMNQQQCWSIPEESAHVQRNVQQYAIPSPITAHISETARAIDSPHDAFNSSGMSSTRRAMNVFDECYRTPTSLQEVPTGWKASMKAAEDLFSTDSSQRLSMDPIGTPRLNAPCNLESVPTEGVANSAARQEEGDHDEFDLVTGLEKAILDLSMLGLSDDNSNDTNLNLK